MQQFEKDYANLINDVLRNGEDRQTRNGLTKAMFGRSLLVPVRNLFPLIQGRKMFPKGIIGEWAALIRQPKNVQDFIDWGCNYWGLWADEETGDLRLGYGNLWFDFNGYNQVAELKKCLRDNPTDRAMIISGWKPDDLDTQSLRCCHYGYQFYVERGTILHMVWTQRSVDSMIGLPSDIVMAAIWLITLAREFNLMPGDIKMDFGDCHIYEEHFEAADKYTHQVRNSHFSPITYKLAGPMGAPFEDFVPSDLQLSEYTCGPKLDLLLKE